MPCRIFSVAKLIAFFFTASSTSLFCNAADKPVVNEDINSEATSGFFFTKSAMSLFRSSERMLEKMFAL